MAKSLDSYGNYYPNLNAGPGTSSGSAMVLSGTGAPSDSNGSDGYLYVDLSSGDIYSKSNGVWTLFSGGGAATPELFAGAADPEGSVTATGPAFYIRDADVNGDRRIYAKPDGVSGNTGWELVLTYQ